MPQVKIIFKLLRIHQWSKNLIIFLPIITSHKLFNINIYFDGTLAFLSMCLLASSTYILNDLLDLENDRKHKIKKYRPLANNSISVSGAIYCAIFIFILSFLISLLLPFDCVILLIIYAFLTISYSFKLKKILILDVIILSNLYTLRLLIGHISTGIELSFWLLAFAIFIFFSLALLKRFIELNEFNNSSNEIHYIPGRGYLKNDSLIIVSLGVSSGLISVLVLLLYANSTAVKILYSYPIFLMFLAPLFLYWISRFWILASRNEIQEDPVIFAVHDKASYVVAILVILVMILAVGVE